MGRGQAAFLSTLGQFLCSVLHALRGIERWSDTFNRPALENIATAMT